MENELWRFFFSKRSCIFRVNRCTCLGQSEQFSPLTCSQKHRILLLTQQTRPEDLLFARNCIKHRGWRDKEAMFPVGRAWLDSWLLTWQLLLILSFLLCFLLLLQCSSVQSLSCVWLFATPWTAARQASLSVTISQNLLKLMSVQSLKSSNHLMLCRPLLLLPSIFPSIRIFSNESVFHIRWPKYWSFSISPSNEYSGLITFRIDWFDLLAVQGIPQESSPIPQFKSIHSLSLSLLYGTTLTFVHDYWKNHSFDCTDFCQQSDVFAF